MFLIDYGVVFRTYERRRRVDMTVFVRIRNDRNSTTFTFGYCRPVFVRI